MTNVSKSRTEYHLSRQHATVGRRTCLWAWGSVSNEECQSESLHHGLQLIDVPPSTTCQRPSGPDEAESVQTQSLGSVESSCWMPPAPTLCVTNQSLTDSTWREIMAVRYLSLIIYNLCMMPAACCNALGLWCGLYCAIICLQFYVLSTA